MSSSHEARLVIPTPLYIASIRDYLQSLAEVEAALPWDPPFDADASEMNQYINNLALGYWSPADRAENASPISHFWYVIDGRVTGRCSLRHQLMGSFGESHGHIGYDVHPKRQNQGIGTQMLTELLELAKRRGMKQLLITCHPDNIASRRVIEKCGGIARDLYQDEYLRFDVFL